MRGKEKDRFGNYRTPLDRERWVFDIYWKSSNGMENFIQRLQNEKSLHKYIMNNHVIAYDYTITIRPVLLPVLKRKPKIEKKKYVRKRSLSVFMD